MSTKKTTTAHKAKAAKKPAEQEDREARGGA